MTKEILASRIECENGLCKIYLLTTSGDLVCIHAFQDPEYGTFEGYSFIRISGEKLPPSGVSAQRAEVSNPLSRGDDGSLRLRSR